MRHVHIRALRADIQPGVIAHQAQAGFRRRGIAFDFVKAGDFGARLPAGSSSVPSNIGGDLHSGISITGKSPVCANVTV